jgi:hypothetical protein
MDATQAVIAKAKELIDAAPSGMRYSQLHREISTIFPEIKRKTIYNALYRFRTKLPAAYYIPARGRYRNIKFMATDEVLPPDQGKKIPRDAKERVIAKAKELIDAAPKGMRYSELHREISGVFPEIKPKTIYNALHHFRTNLPESYYLPDRGLYRNVKFKVRDELVPARAGRTLKTPAISEEDFYEPFTNWLVNELEEATKAICLGGCRFRDKWGTPDVIGIREGRRSDIIEFPTEIISAEIKLDVANLITAFGQCCSYKLFSHKSYLVVPRSSSEEDISRLDSLARIFGIGLILFDGNDPKQPQFTIRVRASRDEPDMFYVNNYLRLVEKELFS